MKTLIIFFVIVSILTIIVTFYKLELNLIIEKNVAGTELVIKFLKGKISKNYKLKSSETQDQSIEKFIDFLKKFLKKKDKRENDYSILLNKISKKIDVKFADINVKIGTPFIFATVISNVIAATVLSIIYKKEFFKENILKYNIIPFYDDFKFEYKIELKFHTNLLNIFLAYIWIKKRNNKIKCE